jgi:hypothetical protein
MGQFKNTQKPHTLEPHMQFLETEIVWLYQR